MDRLKLPGALAAGLLAWQVVALANSPARTEEFSGNDLRDIRLGMAAAELEESGYVDFACAADPKHTLAGWMNRRDCPVRCEWDAGDPIWLRSVDQPGRHHGGGSSGHPDLVDRR